MIEKIVEPCWSDPRTQRRLSQAVTWAMGRLRTSRSTPIQITEIIEHLGDIYRLKTSQWLANRLLVANSQYYNRDQGIARCYTYDPVVAQFIIDTVELGRSTPESWSFREWQQQNHDQYFQAWSTQKVSIDPDQHDDILWNSLPTAQQHELDTGDFAYRDIKDRLWNPIQNLPKSNKRRILGENGFCYHYDINSAAATLLTQLAQQQCPDQQFPAIQAIINDSTPARRHIAQGCVVSQKVAKRIITSMIAGAPVSRWPRTAIFKMVGGNPRAIEWLTQDPEIQQLRQEIRQLWATLDPLLGPKQKIQDRRGYTRNRPRSPSEKWALYFKTERSVLDQVLKMFRSQDIKVLAEHDGWSSRDVIDPRDIEDRIRQRLGYRIKIKYICDRRYHQTDNDFIREMLEMGLPD